MLESVLSRRRWPRGSGAWRIPLCVVLALSWGSSLSASALANGAFPAPFRVFVPAGRPDDVTVTANFGFITTRDGGKTWAWTCEHDQSNAGYLYQQAIAGGGRFLGLAGGNLVLTDDDACGWSVATGFPAGELVDDSFIDPTDAQHVLAIGHRGMGAAAVYELFASRNGGTTFGPASLYATAPGARLDGVEIARSQPSRIYLTTSHFTFDGSLPQLLRSDDAGKTFSLVPPAAALTAGSLLIAAVDPADPEKIYFRLSGDDDRLLISSDGGRTMRVALIAEPGRALTAFLRRASGTLLAATIAGSGGTVFRSTNGGNDFTALSANLHVGSIAERDGILYVLGDGINDGFLVGLSRDDGDTFEPFLDTFAVQGVQTCAKDLRASCAASCLNLENAGLFNAAVCTTLVPPSAPPAKPASMSSGGCASCSFGASPSSAAELFAELVLLLLARAFVSRRAPPRARPPAIDPSR